MLVCCQSEDYSRQRQPSLGNGKRGSQDSAKPQRYGGDLTSASDSAAQSRVSNTVKTRYCQYCGYCVYGQYRMHPVHPRSSPGPCTRLVHPLFRSILALQSEVQSEDILALQSEDIQSEDILALQRYPRSSKHGYPRSSKRGYPRSSKRGYPRSSERG